VEKNKTPLAQAIRQVVAEFGEHPFDINDGRCDEFADRVCELVPDAGVWDLGIEHGHVCIKWNGRYYDAEEPEGVRHWRQLPIIVRNRRK